ncbi:MAG: DUF4388 domain-containing protein [Verrucomicrobiota bacterium]
MQGTISEQDGFLLSDLLQMLCQSKRMGCLELEDPETGLKAFINIKDEKVLNASSGSEHNLEVISKFMAKKRLNFKLLDELRDSEDRIQNSVTNILLDCSLALDKGELSTSEEDSPHTYYTLTKGASQSEGGVSDEDNKNFKQDTDFIQHHSARIGEALNMSVLTAAAFYGPQEKLGMKYIGSETHGVRTRQPLNIAKMLDLL